jgi:DNA replication licensing factor MCM4
MGKKYWYATNSLSADNQSYLNLQPLDDLAAYIEYARAHIHPSISAEAANELVSSYVAMRSLGGSDKRITATTRQLESMIRLSEAHARMRFSDSVQLEDVREAGRLMREAIKSSAMDPRTGKIDMGLLEDSSGMGVAGRKLRDDMRREIMKLLGGPAGTKGIKWTEIVKALSNQSSVRVDAAELGEAVKELEREGVAVVVGERDRRVIRRVEGA